MKRTIQLIALAAVLAAAPASGQARSEVLITTNREAVSRGSAKNSVLAMPVYTDRNRYFTCLYPGDWRQKSFPDETIRSKVEFINPAKADLTIRIIVGPTSTRSVTADSYSHELNEKLPRLRSMFPGITWTSRKATVAGREAVLQTGSGAGLEQRIVNYIHDGFQYSIALNAANKQDFVTGEPMLNWILASLTLDGGSKAMTEADRKAGQVARFKRLALLCEETGQRADALGFAREGLEIDPQSEDLKAIELRLSPNGK